MFVNKDSDKAEKNAEKNDLVSIIMPVYNSKNTICRAIDSIIQQEFTEWELLIIVEKETDFETVEKVISYEKRDPRIKVIKKTGIKGVAKSLNIGLSMSKGAYIARMDSDDVAHKDRLLKQVAYMNANPDVVVVGTLANVCTPNGNYIPVLPLDYEGIKATMLLGDCIVHPSVMFRGDIIRDNRWMYDEKCIAEDYELWLRMIICNRFDNIGEPLIDYYYDDCSNTSSNNDTRRKAVLDVMNSSYRIIFQGYNLSIPELLIGYDYDKNTWMHKPFVLIDVLDFLEGILVGNEKSGYCNQMVLEEVVQKRWNRFLRESYGIDKIHLYNCEKLFLDDILKHSLYKSFYDGIKSESFRDVREFIYNTINALIYRLSQINKVIIYGAGRHCRRFIEYFDLVDEIIAVVDQNAQGKVGNLEIMKPSIIDEKEYDAVFIATSEYYGEVKDYLRNRMIDEEKILPIELLRLKNVII